MNSLRQLIQDSIFQALDEINEQLPSAKRVLKSPAAILAGTDVLVDSFATLNFLVSLEEKLDARFGSSIGLIDDTFAIHDSGSLNTVASLVDHVVGLLEGQRV